MPDLIRILDIARRALLAHQSAMNTASHNIANVNTKGFSRQRITLSSGRAISTAAGLLGSGVNVEGVERIRSRLVDLQLRNERPSFKQNEFKSDALHFVEQIFNEPSDFGLNRMLEDFFDSFSDLANDPQSTANRTVVREKGRVLASGFNRIRKQLTDYVQQLNFDLQQQVDQVNLLTARVADLNEKIVTAEVGGEEAAGLRDSRDLLIDQLSELVDVRATENEFGAVNIAVGGRSLVVETDSQKLALAIESAADTGPKVVFENGGQVADISNGSVKGLLDARDVNVSSYISQLDTFAVGLAEQVNSVHRSGYNLEDITNINFFSANVSGADDFALSAEVLSDATLIATSGAPGEPGNNSTALAIAALPDKRVMSDNQFTFSDFYNSLIAEIGSQAQESDFLKDGFSLTVEKLEFTRESISGVSLDEEMTNLIEAQQAFTAATRLVTTVDEMTQSVLNMV